MDTRERLIRNTQALLWERGYVGTSPKAIQQAAGVGQGSMYHHFNGKSELALAAIQRSAAERLSEAEAVLRGGTAIEQITAYLTLERDVLRGCPVGRLTQDPDIVGDPSLRQPLGDFLGGLCARLADILAAGQQRGELAADLDPADTAATIIATVQGGYVLAKAADSVEPFDHAISGILRLLADSVTR